MNSVQLVVEGHGEQGASQLLLRRIIHERLEKYDVLVRRPQRRSCVPALLARQGEDLIRFQRVAECESDAVLWLLDHDDGCPLDSLRQVYGILGAAGVYKSTAVAFLQYEYETLFLENAECCEDYYGLPARLFSEGVGRRDAKGHISSVLPRGKAYKPTVDQAGLTARLNLEALNRQSRSYRHLESCIGWLLDSSEVRLYPARIG